MFFGCLIQFSPYNFKGVILTKSQLTFHWSFCMNLWPPTLGTGTFLSFFSRSPKPRMKSPYALEQNGLNPPDDSLGRTIIKHKYGESSLNDRRKPESHSYENIYAFTGNKPDHFLFLTSIHFWLPSSHFFSIQFLAIRLFNFIPCNKNIYRASLWRKSLTNLAKTKSQWNKNEWLFFPPNFSIGLLGNTFLAHQWGNVC